MSQSQSVKKKTLCHYRNGAGIKSIKVLVGFTLWSDVENFDDVDDLICSL